MKEKKRRGREGIEKEKRLHLILIDLSIYPHHSDFIQLSIPPSQIITIDASLSLDDAAKAYEKILAEVFGVTPGGTEVGREIDG